VVEVNNRNGFTFRYAEDEPDIAPYRMILSNHHRVLIHPVPCYRYGYLMDSLTANPDVTIGRLRNFMEAVGWAATPGYGGSIQTMVFMPEHLKMGIAFTSLSKPSYEQDPEWIEWTDIFPNHDPQGISSTLSTELPMIQICPNPTTGLFTILHNGSLQNLSIYDTSGRRVTPVITNDENGCIITDLSSLPEGVYICRMKSGEFTASERVVVIR